jgi:hypothetical protein
MLDQKLALVLLVGSDEGIEDEAVERVVDLRDPRQSGGITGNIWAIASGVSGRRTVDPARRSKPRHR